MAVEDETPSNIYGNVPVPENATALQWLVRLKSRDAKCITLINSLGGGLATLMGAYVRDQFGASATTRSHVVSSGSPPVGNPQFKKWFDQQFSAQDSL